MARRRFARDRAGRYRPNISPGERSLLRAVPAEVHDLVHPGEPAARRLFPAAYPADADAERDYRQMMGTQLADHHRAGLATLAATADADAVSEEELHGWLAALEALRLVMGTLLEVTEDYDGVPDPAHPDADRLALYTYLSALQDEVVHALVEALPEAAATPDLGP